MRKLAVAALAFLLCVGVANASGQPPQPARQPVDQAQQQHAEPEQTPSKPGARGSKESPLVVTIPKSQSEATADQQDRAERSDSYRDAWRIGWATIGILIVQAIVFGIQAWRLQQSVKEMKSTTDALKGLAALQRPWLILESPEFAWIEVPGKNPIPRIAYKIKNGGLGPAFIVENANAFRYLEVTNLPAHPFYTHTKSWDGHPVRADGHINRHVLMANGPIDYEKRVKGNGYVFHGFVKYKDSSGDLHETRFCMRWIHLENFIEPIFQDFGTSEYKKHT